jgi:hypothetical protein
MGCTVGGTADNFNRDPTQPRDHFRPHIPGSAGPCAAWAPPRRRDADAVRARALLVPGIGLGASRPAGPQGGMLLSAFGHRRPNRDIRLLGKDISNDPPGGRLISAYRTTQGPAEIRTVAMIVGARPGQPTPPANATRRSAWPRCRPIRCLNPPTDSRRPRSSNSKPPTTAPSSANATTNSRLRCQP